MPLKVSLSIAISAMNAFGIKQSDYRPLPTQTGYRNCVVPLDPITSSLPKLCLIFYKNEPRILPKIKLANQVSNNLAERGWPTRHTVGDHSRILVITLAAKPHYCCLYNYLPGTTIAWEDYTSHHLKLMGQALGFLHRDLLNFSQNIQSISSNECLNLKDKLNDLYNYFVRIDVLQAVEQKLKLQVHLKEFRSFLPLLEWLRQHRSHQLIHLDFVRGNLLFESLHTSTARTSPFSSCYLKDSKQTYFISGILDFEKVSLGAIELELARCLAFLLVDCERYPPSTIFKSFLLSGYTKRSCHSLPNLQLIKPLIQLYLLIDFYHFLLHNPYEDLIFNHHYQNTVKLLNPRLISPLQSCYK
ncbi:MAG TPA: phosphotransferase [Candidatus Woesebacteria bacterium]|nr:phosphotransferase [Candidatus Woesebacteria bacterium]